MDDKLRESEAFGMSLLQEGPNPIVVYNLDGSVKYVNPALENLTGYSREEILGHHFPPLWFPEDKIEQYGFQNRQNLQGTIIEQRIYKKKNGELF